MVLALARAEEGLTMDTRVAKPGFAELFTPKLVTVLREGYAFADFRADLFAGLTVAIVALPLSMAIAIAAGVTPDRGLYTSIVGGFVVSLLGGSRFAIGGPAGAFIVLVAATVALHGVQGLLLATLLSGLILCAVGLLRLGTFIKYIPYPVTVGFTAGIAVIIGASQIKELLGLRLTEPGPILPKLAALGAALPTLSPQTVAVSVLTIAMIVVVRRLRPHWPAYIIGVIGGTLMAQALGWEVATIGSRFGAMPRMLPPPQLPTMSLQAVTDVLPAALSFALLGGIESLLSAVVADSMTGRRHRSNCELVAQGLANVASAMFGGICVTGVIARTATNVRAGARGPVAGLLHSGFVLAFMLIAAPLASYIPLAALASVLVVVCWNMAEKAEFAALLRTSRADGVVLGATFLLVVFRDLTTGILVGFGMATLLFLHRMAQSVEVVQDDRPDFVPGETRTKYDPTQSDPEIAVCRISGAFFFGAAAVVGAALDRIAERPKAFVLDLSGVAMLDSSGAATLAGFVRKAVRSGAQVVVAGATGAVERTLLAHDVGPPRASFAPDVTSAIARLHAERPSRTDRAQTDPGSLAAARAAASS